MGVERQKQINRAVYEAVIACLRQGGATEWVEPIKKISCGEAVEALNYTISQVQNNVPLDFSRFDSDIR